MIYSAVRSKDRAAILLESEVIVMQKAVNPCPACPYKLGIVKTLVNPCPQCRRNNYSFYKEITQQGEVLKEIKKPIQEGDD